MMWTWDIRPVVDLSDDPAQRSDGADVPGFANRSDAETWLGEVWRTLNRNGATTAQLTADGETVGPPVDLAPRGN